MSEQEELRKGLSDCLGGYFNQAFFDDPIWGKAITAILNYLHSQGVVVRVDNINYITASRNKDAFITTVAVEPLIKEVK